MTTQQERLESALARCLEASESGQPETVERVLSEFPDLETQLVDSMAKLSRLGLCDPIPELDEGGIPDRLGGYEIGEPLGGGGMGLVFRARDHSTGREVALKLIRPEQAGLPRARARFRREAEAISRLDHPGIVPLLEEGEDRGVGYLVMELIRGCTLAEALDELKGQDPGQLCGADLGRAVASGTARKYPGQVFDVDATLYAGSWMDACLGIIRCTCLALEHVHRRGLVHRDVKPSNLLLTPDGKVLLFDFGLTRVEDLSRMTRTGSPLGSPAYMAPELIEGKGADERSDIYGLGVTFYEMLTLRLPFEAASLAGLESKILDASCRPPRLWNPGISRDLQVICLHAMQAEPAHRYADMSAWLQDLDRFDQGEPILARPAGSWMRLQRWAKRRPALALTLAVLLVFVVGTPTSLWLLQRSANVELADARDRAEQNLQMALSAVQDLLEVGGTEGIQDRSALQGPGKMLVERAVKLYSDYLQNAADDPRVALARGRIGLVLGDLFVREGKLAKAEATTRAAQRDLKTSTGGAERQVLLIRSDYLLARVLRRQRKLVPAAGLFAKCLAKMQELPQAKAWIALHAQIWAESGALHLDRGSAREAEQAYGQALELLQSVPDPDRAQGKQLGATLIRWGQSAAWLQKRGVARERYEKAVTLYEKLRSQDPQSFLVRLNQSRAYILLAGMEARMSQLQEAHDHDSKALEILRGLAREQPGYPDLRVRLADLLSRLAALDLDLGEVAASRAKFAEAQAQFEDLWREVPNLSELASSWLAHLARRSGILLREGRDQEAMKVLALAENLPEPDLAQSHLFDIDKLCRVLRNVATLARRQKRWGQAEKSFDRVVGIRRWVLEQMQKDPASQMSLAYALNNLANLYRETKRKDLARKVLREAIALKREVLIATPESGGRTYSLGLSLHNLAGLLIEADRKPEAMEILDEAVERQEQALLLQDVKRVRIQLCNSLEAQALLRCDLGDPGLLLGAAERIRSLLPQRSSTAYRVGLLLCRYLTVAGDSLKDDARSELEEEVVTELGEALQRKRLTKEALFQDVRLDSVRNSAAFVRRFGKEEVKDK